jgi:hypothetical protein
MYGLNLLPRSPVSLSSGGEVPPLYTKVASAAKKSDRQCKRLLQQNLTEVLALAINVG